MDSIASQITNLTTVCSTVYSGADQRKHQSSASLAFVWGIQRWPVNSPHKWPVTRKMFPFDDVIMIPQICLKLCFEFFCVCQTSSVVDAPIWGFLCWRWDMCKILLRSDGRLLNCSHADFPSILNCKQKISFLKWSLVPNYQTQQSGANIVDVLRIKYQYNKMNNS